MKQGFLQGCRPFLGMDGCHLKGLYGCVLLTAITLDANLSIYPIAVAIVECENKDSWSFFIYHLLKSIGGNLNEKPWTIMSDYQKV